MKQGQEDETKRGERVIRLAKWLMKHAQARGWSDAMEQARKAVRSHR